ncbi:hypothetical protein SOCE26_034750 [Sorangium cellulosum]|uniref:Secreted protein n=2 Tax=Sorangium cellulosum TaxID=56 RepID=A0A2L0ES10_SORCE|nr:hypothetical protein SOCE26_034750 [Sorangium cellulosum]
MVLLALLSALPGVSACAELVGDQDAHAPGTALGTFHVVGEQRRNSCGAGALGATRSWEFDVALARDEGALFWNNGGSVIEGVIEDDQVSFVIESRVVVDMRAGDAPPGPPCSVERRDQARGELDGAGEDVAAFEATLSYDFAPTAGSHCEDLVVGDLSVAPVFDALPCWMDYDLTGTRSGPPPPE